MMGKVISWVEIPAADFRRAVDFYKAVFRMELQVIDCGEEKMACFPGGEGAISFAQDFEPSPNGVLVSLNAGDDLEWTLERIRRQGGAVVRGKTKIEAEGRGYFALFIDSEGNKVGLYGDQ